MNKEDYISTLECPNILPGRGVGNTIRQADFAIQKLFEGKVVFVEDHCYRDVRHLQGSQSTKKHSRHLLDIILNRLKSEHRIQSREVFRDAGDIYMLVPNVRIEEPIYYVNKEKL